MRQLSRFRIHKQVAASASVEVSEKNGVRYLHLGSETIQSAMRRSRPNDLELSYTRCMMAFLLFVPTPSRVVMIGLGGGSLARFVYHNLPETLITAVEINPQVVSAARQFFELPDDPGRLAVEIGDGVEYVRSHRDAADVLMIDGFGADEAAPGFGTAAFYSDCARTLTNNGVLVTNLFTREKDLNRHLRLLGEVFDGRLLCLTDERGGNLIALGFARGQNRPAWKSLRRRAGQLTSRCGLEFGAFVDELERMNPHDPRRLFI